MAASVVIIEERTGSKRRVELVGGGLPIQGANWSGLQLLVTNWNPGNPEATQHVLGPQEVPSDWDFVWNTTRLIRTPITVQEEGGQEFEVTRASTLATILEDIFRGGALLKVTWISSAAEQSQPSPRQSRIGRASEWDFAYDRPDDINGSVSFAWIGRGEDQPKASDVRGQDPLALTQAAINAANAAAAAVARDVIRNPNRNQEPGASTFTLGQLEAIANGPRELMDSFARAANSISNRLKKIGDIIITVKETPAAILGRLVDVANNGVSVANQFMDQVTREGPETQSLRNKVNVLTKNASYFSASQNQAANMAVAMELLAEAARRRQSSVIPSAGSSRRQDKMRTDDNFQIHIPRADETMLTIAQKYYGSPDLADELAIANGLPGYTITPPRMPLIIPTRRNLEESTRNRV